MFSHAFPVNLVGVSGFEPRTDAPAALAGAEERIQEQFASVCGSDVPPTPQNVRALVNSVCDIGHTIDQHVVAREFAANVSYEYHAEVSGQKNLEKLRELTSRLRAIHDASFEGVELSRRDKYTRFAEACGYRRTRSTDLSFSE